jgi:hypothetical protein
MDAPKSSINQIIQSFEGLGENDREATMKALSTLMGVDNQGTKQAKKKVNGFMGYRGMSESLYNNMDTFLTLSSVLFFSVFSVDTEGEITDHEGSLDRGLVPQGMGFHVRGVL